MNVNSVVYDLQAVESPASKVSQRSEARQLPFKPTARMIAAGSKAGRVRPDVAWQIYRAMFDAVDLLPDAEIPERRLA
jgi:hypothetical protein